MLDSMKLKSQMIFLMGVGAAAMILIGALSSTNLNEVLDGWTTGLDDKIGSYTQLRKHIGYGGMIHRFKNYVLRGKESDFTKSVEHAAEAKKQIEQYRAEGSLAPIEVESLNAIESMMDAYSEGLQLAISLRKEGRSTAEIDQAVKIDDGPFLTALSNLEGYLLQRADERAANLRERVDEVVDILIGVVAAGILGFIVLGGVIVRSVLRKVGGEPNEIADVAEDLAVGNLDVAFSGTQTTGIKRALQQLVESLSIKADLARHIAQGDLSTEVTLASEKDSLGRSLQLMLETLRKKEKLAQTIADGDLTAQIQLASNHDALGISLRNMTTNLNEVISQVVVASSELQTGSEQISQSSQVLAEGASQQAASLEEITASMQQMSAQTSANADSASQASRLAANARELAEKGNAQMKKMLDAMHRINESSENISKIIKTIDEIAFQTNLLAINAAVEAARAGVHGKGFAVVAEEVRNLAQRSATAAKETTSMIESSIKKVESGAEIADETAVSLGEIVEGSVKVTDLVQEISSASQEQAKGIEEINKGLAELNQVTQNNAQVSEETASASEELTGQAQNLRVMTDRFTLTRRQHRSSVSSSTPARRPALPGPGPRKTAHKESPSKVESSSAVKAKSSTPQPRQSERPHEDPESVISLSDSDFGKF